MEEHEFVIMFWPQPVQSAPPPPPPPPQLQNFNQAILSLRTVETKVAGLEAQMGEMQLAIEEMSQKSDTKLQPSARASPLGHWYLGEA